MRAQAYSDLQQPVAAARELIASARMTTPGEPLQQLHDRIWELLSRLDDTQLRQAAREENDYYEQGWFELALAARGSSDLLSSTGGLEQWRTLWSNHPAYSLPPTSLGAVERGEILAVRRIGLLLPLSGPLAEPARAISEGFYAALYADPSRRPQVVSIDSSAVNTAAELHSLATQQQLDLIIGPLSRDFVARLSQVSNPPVPVLALNQAATDNAPLYQLDLASEQETALVAQRAWEDGHRRVALITPDAPWGQQLASRFEQYFTALGGQVVTRAGLPGR